MKINSFTNLSVFKLILFVFLSILILTAFAQEENKKDKATIKILHSDLFYPGVTNKINRAIGNVSLQHQNIFMTCDSLYQYSDSNYIEAFGNVHAIQSDTLNLWGDFMTYSGNTEFAQVRNHVIMNDQKITLTTDSLDYDAAGRVGYYFNGGTIKDSINTLKSEYGYYYLPINEMFFKDSVKVYTPDYTMFSDTMKYQTETKIITILGPTNIYGDNRTLYSENGWYNSITSHAELYKNNKLSYNDYKGVADTIIIDSTSNNAIMQQNITLYDTVNNVLVQGNYGEVWKKNDYAFVTQRALLTLVGEADSLFVHGDTLSISKDSLGNNVMKAYHNTKFYNKELQGVCDSMVFPIVDSTVYLYVEPIVWAGGNQMTAQEITMHLKDNNVDHFNLNTKAMLINQMDSTKFNQIKGRNMIGYIKNNEIYMVYVDGSGEALYYLDDQGVIVGLDHTTSSTIKIFIEERKVKDIIFINNVDGVIIPLFMVKPQDTKLKDFFWHIGKKPLNKEAIFNKQPVAEEPTTTEKLFPPQNN